MQPRLPGAPFTSHMSGDDTPPSPTRTAVGTSPSKDALPSSPMRFATSTNAFGLAVSPTSSTSSRDGIASNIASTSKGFDPRRSPPPGGSVSAKRLRRPSLLSLAQTASFSSDHSIEDTGGPSRRLDQPAVMITDPSSSTSTQLEPQILQPAPYAQRSQQWSPFLSPTMRFSRTTSVPSLGMEGLKASTPPLRQSASMELDGSGSASPVETEGEAGQSEAELDARSPLRWAPSHLQTSASRRKGKGKMEDADAVLGPGSSTSAPHPNQLHGPPFTGRPLPASLLATLISESTPLQHEMESEARLQRFISSHPSALPLTPRAPRSSRGRFPEMVGGEDDDEDHDLLGRSSWAMRSWLSGGRAGSTSDSDSDDDQEPEPVNSAFAAGMDMDRPTSSSSAGMWTNGSLSDHGSHAQATPPHLGPPWPNIKQGGRLSFSAAGTGMSMVPSPGSGFALPSAFGGLGMGGNGGTTPAGSPTVERLELSASPGANMSSPGLMQYRDSSASASLRPGKRKVQPEDRYDPYKRPRGGSPSLGGHPMSPSRPSAIPIPQSPSTTLFASNYQLSTSHPSRRTHNVYGRPIANRSRAASPALSIGSASGVLSTSLGNGNNGFGPGGTFIPTNKGALAAQGLAQAPLGSLGLMTLANVGEAEEEVEGVDVEGVEETHDTKEVVEDAMEED